MGWVCFTRTVMALHIETIEPEGEPPTESTTVLVHGFTQNTKCWGPFATTLATRVGPLRAVDLPGHGRSHHDDADLPTAAQLTTEAVASVGGADTWIGYSMGGRVLLHAALAAPEQIGRLALVGATPGLTDAAERADRVAADDQLASRLSADGLDAFLDFWLALPLFAGLNRESSARSARALNRPDGLASSLRMCGTGTQQPLWDRLDELSMPVTVIAGETDTKFCAIGADMAAAIGPNAQFKVIDGAGHACHLEDPAATVAAILND